MLTDRFDEGLMVLRNLLGWRLIDMSYSFLNKTRSKSPNKTRKRRAAVKDHMPTFDELSIQVKCISRVQSVSRLLAFTVAAPVEYLNVGRRQKVCK